MPNKIVITHKEQMDISLQCSALFGSRETVWRTYVKNRMEEAGAPIESWDLYSFESTLKEGWAVHSQVDHETKAIEICWEYRDSSLPANPTGLYILLLFVCAVIALGLYLGTIWTLTSQ